MKRGKKHHAWFHVTVRVSGPITSTVIGPLAIMLVIVLTIRQLV
ncbi:hypothetical protein ATK36_0710 [Amycolatopsis sulphurea]|uniref:Uncharacterized protein n=1 Tax=Amycolatopsis sulphurea TaxID=76022 RepID=A0A2A9G2I3_9PSEU|nr:hypothetical protein [Amycolatopsis sulphurea]PFG57146.1 hypothetical protein ATK36_0710 [Amycolatopsis sulphurea]